MQLKPTKWSRNGSSLCYVMVCFADVTCALLDGFFSANQNHFQLLLLHFASQMINKVCWNDWLSEMLFFSMDQIPFWFYDRCCSRFLSECMTSDSFPIAATPLCSVDEDRDRGSLERLMFWIAFPGWCNFRDRIGICHCYFCLLQRIKIGNMTCFAWFVWLWWKLSQRIGNIQQITSLTMRYFLSFGRISHLLQKTWCTQVVNAVPVTLVYVLWSRTNEWDRKQQYPSIWHTAPAMPPVCSYWTYSTKLSKADWIQWIITLTVWKKVLHYGE